MLATNVRFAIGIVLCFAFSDALPVLDDRPRTGSEILTALQIDLPAKERFPVYDAKRSVSCAEITAAEGKKGAPFRLVMAALRDFNPELSQLSCKQASSQVTEVLTLYVSIKGSDASGESVTKDCKLLRLRHAARGSDASKIIFDEPEINEDGSKATSPEQLEKIREHNRYAIEYCDAVPDEAIAEDEIVAEAQLDHPKYSTGYIPPPKELWDALRNASEPSAEELLQIPSSYDERDGSGVSSCQSYKIVDQGSCGSCWAFAGTRVYGDRICRQTKGRWNVALSEQHLVQCNRLGSFYTRPKDDGTTQLLRPAGTWQAGDGCQGSSPVYAWILMSQAEGTNGGSGGGFVSRWAAPYTCGGYQANCPGGCSSYDSKAIKFKVGSTNGDAEVYKIPAGTGAVNTIKHVLHTEGSVSAGFDVYPEFMQYKSGVWKRQSSQPEGGHAVAVIGWGTDNGDAYWLFANSWNEGWGENGYGRIRLGTNEADFESSISFPKIPVPTLCSSASDCKNGGEFDSTCACRCDPTAQWSGADCGTCSGSCSNDGVLNTATCTCKCQPGYFGSTCDQYVRLSWRSVSGSTGILDIAWSLGHSHTGSYFKRFAGPQGGNGGNVAISGTTKVISGSTGSETLTVNVYSYINGYPSGFYYVFHNSLGKNEFGASRGFSTVEMPHFEYDTSNRCVKGGHEPSPSVLATLTVCSGYAYTGSPTTGGTGSGVPPPPTTPAPSQNPTRTPSRTPSRRPSATPSRAPSKLPTTMPTPAPTDTPTFSPSTPGTPPSSVTASPSHAPTLVPTPATPVTTPDTPPVKPTPTAAEDPLWLQLKFHFPTLTKTDYDRDSDSIARNIAEKFLGLPLSRFTMALTSEAAKQKRRLLETGLDVWVTIWPRSSSAPASEPSSVAVAHALIDVAKNKVNMDNFASEVGAKADKVEFVAGEMGEGSAMSNLPEKQTPPPFEPPSVNGQNKATVSTDPPAESPSGTKGDKSNYLMTRYVPLICGVTLVALISGYMGYKHRKRKRRQEEATIRILRAAQQQADQKKQQQSRSYRERMRDETGVC